MSSLRLQSLALFAAVFARVSMAGVLNLLHRNLASNLFFGTIPAEWAAMTSLQILYISGNSLDGALPELLRMPNLKHLDLSRNSLKGTLPRVWAETMYSLEVVNLADNQITGSLPATWVV